MENQKIIQAYIEARKTFKYFWRELYWEHRRIVPALDLSIVKVAFEQKIEGVAEPITEHMWIDQINFDGELINGVLINSPNQLTNIANGDTVSIPLDKIDDWMFSTQGKTYGGFTIQALRSMMTSKEKEEHDKAWGLDFGDFNDILVVYEQKEHPQNLIEHPMSINMREKIKAYLTEHPEVLLHQDENGYTMLHTETIAGNKTVVELLLEFGVSKSVKTSNGKLALDFANQLNWEHIVNILI